MQARLNRDSAGYGEVLLKTGLSTSTGGLVWNRKMESAGNGPYRRRGANF
jgi:hypothetical protein